MKNKNWPIYFKDNLILGNIKSEIGIVTLWTPVRKITDKIKPDSFCLAGQLYSKEGINYIIRNILASPSIRHLLICGSDLSGSGKALIDFLKKGIDKERNIIGASYALIHREIPLKKIEVFRKNVGTDNLIGINDFKKVAVRIKKYQPVGKDFDKPRVFPLPTVKGENYFPTDQSIFKVTNRYIGQVWLEIMKIIWRFGRTRETWYGNPVREVFNVAAVITEEDPLKPKIFPYFSITKNDIEKYCRSFLSSKKGDEIYTYGERLFGYKGVNQVEDVIVPFLKKYPTDRAALAVIFDIFNDHKAERAPCMCLVQATALDDKLNLTAYFRSHDLFSGWILNAFGLRRLQGQISKRLKLDVGTLTIISNCAHVYDNQWKAIEKIVKKYGDQPNCLLDPRGYFVINVSGREIITKLYSPEGLFLEEYRQDGTKEKAAMFLYQKMVANNAVSLIPHALDLGIELQKAETAIKLKIPYQQDKPLKFEKNGKR